MTEPIKPTTVLKAGTIVHFHGYPVRLLATVTIEATEHGIQMVNKEKVHYGER